MIVSSQLYMQHASNNCIIIVVVGGDKRRRSHLSGNREEVSNKERHSKHVTEGGRSIAVIHWE